MKKLLFMLTCCAIGFCEIKDSEINNLSETLGHLIVKQLKNPDFEFNIDLVIQGMIQAQEGKPSPMTQQEYEQKVSQMQESMFLKLAESNLDAANTFLEKNAVKKEVTCLNPQLQYSVLKKGKGDAVSNDSEPMIHYTGKLLDGTVFSTSTDKEDPLCMPMTQTIPGFNKGLLGMKEGEKRVLYIHPDLAYGTDSQDLPPNSLLIFEVEVIKANKEDMVCSKD